MSLTKLWASSPDQLESKHIKQVIAFAGNGKLTDEGEASTEFRNYLSHIPAIFLNRYANECLKDKFDESGFALQDIVNEVGKRLGFKVTNGRYRGVQNQSGHDGCWISNDGYGLLVEVKTTDAFRIDLNNVANYRQQLIEDRTLLPDRSAVLIIVGRNDTGDLEAQIRGSRHAWDIRLISVEALLRLMKIKEDVEDPKIIHQLVDILIPREYTKLDSIIDLVFSTAEDIQDEIPEDAEHGSEQSKFIPVSFHNACIRRIEISLQKKLIKQTRATYMSADGNINLVCSISRIHDLPGKNRYWYSFSPPPEGIFVKNESGIYCIWLWIGEKNYFNTF